MTDIDTQFGIVDKSIQGALAGDAFLKNRGQETGFGISREIAFHEAAVVGCYGTDQLRVVLDEENEIVSSNGIYRPLHVGIECTMRAAGFFIAREADFVASAYISQYLPGFRIVAVVVVNNQCVVRCAVFDRFDTVFQQGAAIVGEEEKNQMKPRAVRVGWKPGVGRF